MTLVVKYPKVSYFSFTCGQASRKRIVLDLSTNVKMSEASEERQVDSETILGNNLHAEEFISPLEITNSVLILVCSCKKYLL
jgi:hypothetical protein